MDYRRLNQVTVKDGYPLPSIPACLDSLAEATTYSTLDLQSGYWQITVSKTATERQQKDHDTRISERRYEMGDLVYCKNMGKTVGRSLLEPNKWLGPCVVLKCRSDLSYVVKRGPQDKRRTVHHDNLKPWCLQDVPEWILELQKQLGSAPTINPATSKLKDPDTGSQTPGDRGLIATPAIAADKASGDRPSVSSMPQHDFAARRSTRRRRPPHRYMPQ